MSNFDHILSLVNNIESKASQLISNSQDSLNLLNYSDLLNQEIANIDQEQDEIDDLINHNRKYQQHFQGLNERLFYLEQSLHHNDLLVNKNLFEGLTEEYMTVVDKLKVNDSYTYSSSASTVSAATTAVQEQEDPDVSWSSIDDVEDEEIELELPQETNLQSPPDVKKMISISNLKLKPIRCTSNTKSLIQKKKSRYRLSAIYNINPIAYEESTSESSTTDTSFNIPSTPPPVFHNPEPSTPPTRIISSGGESTSTYESSNLMQADEGAHHDATASSVSSASPISKPRRVKSMDETIDPENIFKEFNCDQDVLRFNRLKHFISLNHLPSAPTHEDINTSIDYDNYDVVSVCSDMSYYSPPTQNTEHILSVDDFSKFLRSSRVELNKDIRTAFPHLVPDSHTKFHNPSEHIHRGTPTLSTISKDVVKTKYQHKQASRDLLNQVISSALPVTPPTSPQYNRRHSPKHTPRKRRSYSSPMPTQSPKLRPTKYSSPTRFPLHSPPVSNKKSTTPSCFSLYDEKSIATSLLELLQSKTSLTIPLITSPSKQKPKPRGSIKQMCILRDLENKSRLHRTSPIRGINDSQLKRLPQIPTFTIESNGKATLTIDTKNSDVFKQPVIVRSYNEKALKEALAVSLLD
ncbi:hypothetical protein JA1_003105 [Spathaspora sp. JA1]|nr:hypothetical protein JA1_003105 [Spathaspora sp. JA1]